MIYSILLIIIGFIAGIECRGSILVLYVKATRHYLASMKRSNERWHKYIYENNRLRKIITELEKQ